MLRRETFRLLDSTTPSLRDRARGVLLGQLVGDALGTTVEFSSAAAIARRYPKGLRDIVGGGPFQLLPGQITDDSELALALARTLADAGWDLDARARAYSAWYRSGPFDIGNATRAAFGGLPVGVAAAAMAARAKEHNGAAGKQANGALMRVSPVALFGAFLPAEALVERAREDARLSHPSAVCQAANAAFVAAIQALLHGASRDAAWARAKEAVAGRAGCPEVLAALEDTAAQPACDGSGQGWVLVALRNAFYLLRHESSFEEALVKTVMAGGDADTNACIAGALLGACGLEGIPARWVEKVLTCRSPRGAPYQATDALALADRLLERGFAEARRVSAPQAPRPSGPPAGNGVKTSDTDPIYVAWLQGQDTPGKVGLTLAPGKHSVSKYSSGRWQRDLAKDLDALVQKWRAEVLVCLLEDGDLQRLGIPDLVERAEERGLEVMRFPIRDVSVAGDVHGVAKLVEALRERAAAGKNVVVHCEGGLGRAGTIGGCYLALLGHDAEEILNVLARSRSPKCPETEEQRQFIRDFAKRVRGARA